MPNVRYNQLVVFAPHNDSLPDEPKQDRNLLGELLKENPFLSVLLNQVLKKDQSDRRVFAIDKRWSGPNTTMHALVFENGEIQISTDVLQHLTSTDGVLIRNGRFLCEQQTIQNIHLLDQFDTDLITIRIHDQLSAGHEKVITDDSRRMIGFRRYYMDTVQPAPTPPGFPDMLLIRNEAFKRLCHQGVLPVNIDQIIRQCDRLSLKYRHVQTGGTRLDLNDTTHLLNYFIHNYDGNKKDRSAVTAAQTKYQNVQISGPVVFGHDVHLGKNVTIIGPAIIGNNTTITDSCVIYQSIIGNHQRINDRFLKHRVVFENLPQISPVNTNTVMDQAKPPSFRHWSRFSYPASMKRVFDILASIIILILFLPVFPIIAAAVKLSSKGPVFYKAQRQGLHGRPFHCLKFRTMLVGADKIQQKLRGLNKVDGPQFSIPDDPRISPIGQFLRNTYLDEIPQFVNVLLGQMSIVGPRPSPESENTLCPFWRDARLSVRPGITGLWQIYRTRKPKQDFQEWIYYDIQYIRNLRLRQDIWICLNTVIKMVRKFVEQF